MPTEAYLRSPHALKITYLNQAILVSFEKASFVAYFLARNACFPGKFPVPR